MGLNLKTCKRKCVTKRRRLKNASVVPLFQQMWRILSLGTTVRTVSIQVAAGNPTRLRFSMNTCWVIFWNFTNQFFSNAWLFCMYMVNHHAFVQTPCWHGFKGFFFQTQRLDGMLGAEHCHLQGHPKAEVKNSIEPSPQHQHFAHQSCFSQSGWPCSRASLHAPYFHMSSKTSFVLYFTHFPFSSSCLRQSFSLMVGISKEVEPNSRRSPFTGFP